MAKDGKSVKGLISLVAALLCIVCIIVSYIPFTPITIEGTNKSVVFFSDINVILPGIAVLLALIAIVAGIMAGKDKDKSGPKRVGMIIGIFGIIIALITCGVTALMNEVGKFAQGKDCIFSESLKDNPDLQKSLDDFKKSLAENAQ